MNEVQDAIRAAVIRVLRYRPQDVLVGGYALEVWANRYRIDLTGERELALTRDLDFVGRPAFAQQPGENLAFVVDAHWKVAGWEDAATPNTGLVTVPFEYPEGYAPSRSDPQRLVIDYLATVAGLTSREIQNNAITLELDLLGTEISLQLMHPVDLLISRAANIIEVPGKDSPKGWAQLGLAEEVVQVWRARTLAAEQPDLVARQRKRVAGFVRSRAGQAIRGRGVDLAKGL